MEIESRFYASIKFNVYYYVKDSFPNLLLYTYLATVCTICFIFVPSFERNAIFDEYYPTTINESTNVHWLVFYTTMFYMQGLL